MISLDFYSRIPIYRQIVERITELILLGVWPEGTQLPSVRSLAASLGTNPNTIQKAYQELESQGVISSAAGRGSFVQGKEAAQGVFREQAKKALEGAARPGPLAYIETDYAGGVGTQAGVLLERGKVVLGPVEGEGTVNRLLNAIGVWHRPGEDEFDALSLGRYRHMPL